jgi:hypothetical protein
MGAYRVFAATSLEVREKFLPKNPRGLTKDVGTKALNHCCSITRNRDCEMRVLPLTRKSD